MQLNINIPSFADVIEGINKRTRKPMSSNTLEMKTIVLKYERLDELMSRANKIETQMERDESAYIKARAKKEDKLHTIKEELQSLAKELPSGSEEK